MWQWYALVAMACFAAMQLVFRHLGTSGVDSAAVLLAVFVFGAVLYLAHVRVTGATVPATWRVVALLAGTAVLSYVGNLFSVRAVTAAPNPGYAVALVSLQGAVVTVIATGLLGASFTWIKMVGVALCCAGVALLVI
jgi:drug/metabolite transporter (DMT)-like permease